MKSLDEAVQKFKSLKQKLKLISQQPNKTTKYSMGHKYSGKIDKKNLINFQNVQHFENKQKPTTAQPKPIKTIKPDQKFYAKTSTNTKTNNQKQIQQQDHKNQTQKKGKHKKQHSWNYSTQNITKLIQKQNKLNVQRYKNKDMSCQRFQLKIGSLNNSRVSSSFSRQLKSKQQTLNQINQLLEKKKQVLETLQRKLGTTYLQQSKFSQNFLKAKHSIRAPNLFQMQNQGRKRSKSKPLTIRWK